MSIQQTPAAATGGKLSVIDQFRRDLEKMGPQFSYALPAHIPVERFTRVVMTAIQNNPKLLACTRQSIFNACMKCAQDGLLPDNREAAIVPFGENAEDGRKSSDQATYLPMIAGIRKKARNSGELSDWYAEVVHAGDEFDYQLGDAPHILHKPALKGGRARAITHAYSIAKFKDGGISREVMTIDEVEDIRRKYSRSKKGPWNDPITYPEMVRKTVARLHAKQLPSSTDLDTLLHRDDELYDMKGAAERGKAVTKRQPANAMAALEQFGAGEPPAQETDAAERDDPGDPRPGDGTTIDQSTGEVETQSQDEPEPTVAELIGKAQKHPPKDPETFKLLVRQVIAAAKPEDAAMLSTWWAGPNARSMRNGAQMTSADTDELTVEVKAAITEMAQ
jgi:recombination protein RecT